MATTIIAVYGSREKAEEVCDALGERGVDPSRVYVLSSHSAEGLKREAERLGIPSGEAERFADVLREASAAVLVRGNTTDAETLAGDMERFEPLEAFGEDPARGRVRIYVPRSEPRESDG